MSDLITNNNFNVKKPAQLVTNKIPIISPAVGLVTDLIPAQPQKELDIIVTNYANTYLKPKLLQTHKLVAGNENAFDNHTPYPDRDNIQLYANGKPVITKVILESDAYEVEVYDEKTKSLVKAKLNASKIELETVLLDVQMSKNIIRTHIDGLNGTVKEFISNGDYAVTIRGALVNKKGTAFPLTDMQKFIAISNAPISIKVTSDFLNLFSIHYLVIENINLPQKEGYTNTQLFELQCLSDIALDVIKLYNK